jgi:type II secretion system protein H
MLKSETGMRTNNSGFTLVEILVVVVILGITATMAVMALGDFGETQRITASAERFASKLRLVRYHAILEATPYQIKRTADSYQVLKFTPPNLWEKSNIKGGVLHALPLNKNILIQASGEITPVTLTFGKLKSPAIATISTTTDSKITLKRLS